MQGDMWPRLSVYLCHWHVKRAWLQNLLAKCGKGMPTARMGEVMAMLKHHDESDAAFLARVQQSMDALYAHLLSRRAV